MPRPSRIDKINSLLREVISDVIRTEVKHPDVGPMVTVSSVDTSRDLHHAKVFVSVLGDDKERDKTLAALQSASGFIAVTAAKQIVLRYFPELTFKLDLTVDKQIEIEGLIKQIHEERSERDVTGEE